MINISLVKAIVEAITHEEVQILLPGTKSKKSYLSFVAHSKIGSIVRMTYKHFNPDIVLVFDINCCTFFTIFQPKDDNPLDDFFFLEIPNPPPSQSLATYLLTLSRLDAVLQNMDLIETLVKTYPDILNKEVD